MSVIDMSDMSEFHFIPYTKLNAAIKQRLQQAGLSAERAEIETQILTEADLLETPSHGVRMLPALIAGLESGRVLPEPEIKIEREFAAISVVNYANGPGRFAAQDAMQRATHNAKQFGVGICLAKNTTHWGRAHAYAYRTALSGCVGICTTNAMPTMAIGGATRAVIGNNPLAIGIPSTNVQEPFVLDMAMSQAAVGKIATWLREGREVPKDWGLDENGKPTIDASKILKGAVLPMGEHKGAGLAFMFELLTAALAGAAFTQQIYGADQSGLDAQSTKIFIALDVEKFIDPEEFNQKTNEFLSYLRDEAAPFHYPGERGWQAKEKNLLRGVPIHKDIIAQLNNIGITF